MSSVRFEGMEWVDGSIEQCHSYLVSCYKALDFMDERFWIFRDDDEYEQVFHMTSGNFMAQCERLGAFCKYLQLCD